MSYSAVVIGNRQIFHKGHYSIFEQALLQYEHLIVILNSAFRSRDSCNPFTTTERQEMIQSSLPKHYCVNFVKRLL